MGVIQQDVNLLRQMIERLLLEYPDIAEDEILRADMLQGETDLFGLLTELHRRREDNKALIEGTQARMEDLSSRKKRFGARVDFLTRLMQSLLEAADLRKVELPEMTLSLRNNPQVMMGNPDPYALPDELVNIKREVNRAKIKDALREGKQVDGCYLSNAAPSLMVRVK